MDCVYSDCEREAEVFLSHNYAKGRLALCRECHEALRRHEDARVKVLGRERCSDIIRGLQRDVEDYVDGLRKSNDMFRKSQDELAGLILQRIQDFKVDFEKKWDWEVGL